MLRRRPRSTPLYSSAASDVYKRQIAERHFSTVDIVGAVTDYIAVTMRISPPVSRGIATQIADNITMRQQRKKAGQEYGNLDYFFQFGRGGIYFHFRYQIYKVSYM